MICILCPHHCDLLEGQTGFCNARTNRNGAIICNNYGKLTSLALDPIEKKPLARFFPGSMILSVGSYGCNLRCQFCQNYEISMADESTPTTYVSPEQLIQKAQELVSQGNIGIAFTYNEPLVGYEYVLDCSMLAHEQGLKTVVVTNGTICGKSLVELLPYIDAMNIDLKGFTQEFYNAIKGDLQTVKATIALAAKACHVEVTTLIIPGENDSEQEMEALSEWLASISSEIPLHISRFFPKYKMQGKAPTPLETIFRLKEIAEKYLTYVYVGNCG